MKKQVDRKPYHVLLSERERNALKAVAKFEEHSESETIRYLIIQKYFSLFGNDSNPTTDQDK